MSQTTVMLGRAIPAENDVVRDGGFLSRIATRVMAARQARADRFVRPYLARLPASELAVLGFTEAEIASLRRDRHLPVALRL